MAHYRPIHKYCLQYYHFQALSAPLRFIPFCSLLLFLPPSFLFFSLPPLSPPPCLPLLHPPSSFFFNLPIIKAPRCSGQHRKLPMREQLNFVPFDVETGPEEHPVTLTSDGKCHPVRLENLYNKWWQSAPQVPRASCDLDWASSTIHTFAVSETPRLKTTQSVHVSDKQISF